MSAFPKRDHTDELNRLAPAAFNAQMGTVLADLVAKHNALCVKLDADTGVAATNHAATLSVVQLGGKP
jgi:hypothetical protein